MTNKQLERRLAQAWGALRPKTEFDTIVGAIPASVASAARKRFPRRGLVAAVLAACLAVSLVVGGLLSLRRQPPTQMLTLIDIDVNPGIELAVDAADRVVTVQAVNADGKRVLNGLTLSDQSLPEAVTALFDRMVAQGYVAGEDNCILVTVQTADNAEADRIADAVSTTIDAALAQHDIAAPVATQTVVDFAAVTDFAEQNGISKGKANFILSLKEKEPSLDAAKLAQYPFSALAAIAQNLEVPLDSLTDYDAVSGLNKQLADALKKEAAEIGAILLTDLLTPEEAKAKALAYLRDWEAAEALFVKAELRWDGGVPVYQFELIVRNQVYEFAVNALDGGYEPPESQQKPTDSTTTATTVGNGPQIVYSTLPGGGTAAFISTNKYMTTTTAPSATSTTAPTSGAAFTKEQAKRVVLKMLGVTEDEVEHIFVSTVPPTLSANEPSRFQVQVVRKGLTYQFYVDGGTGKVYHSVFRNNDLLQERYLLSDREALDIALLQAGIMRDTCVETTVLYWLDDDDVPCFYVYLITDRQAYTYRIDAADGTVLSREVSAVP